MRIVRHSTGHINYIAGNNNDQLLVETWKRSLIKSGEWQGIEDTWIGNIRRRGLMLSFSHT